MSLGGVEYLWPAQDPWKRTAPLLRLEAPGLSLHHAQGSDSSAVRRGKGNPSVEANAWVTKTNGFSQSRSSAKVFSTMSGRPCCIVTLHNASERSVSLLATPRRDLNHCRCPSINRLWTSEHRKASRDPRYPVKGVFGRGVQNAVTCEGLSRSCSPVREAGFPCRHPKNLWLR